MHERFSNPQVLAAALDGHVLLCTDVATGDAVAIKRMHLASAKTKLALGTSNRVSEDATMELHVHRILSANGGHANVLRLRDHFHDESNLYLVLNYCPGGDLFTVLRTHGTLEMATVWTYFRQIVQGVAYMHRQGYAHRDLSLENILLDGNGNCCVCDFGLATPVSAWVSQKVGKLFYMAPEVVAAALYDPTKADVWSLGIMLFMLVTGTPLLGVASNMDRRYRYMISHGLQRLVAHTYKQRIDAKVMMLLEGMLATDPRLRLTLDDVVKRMGESRGQLSHRTTIGQTIKRWFQPKKNGGQPIDEPLILGI
ncbi:CAMK/CAMKL protein kinase [Aphanomyces astaci]|uniref:CAMK/CAMKL protein kinase n=1 Tax=Aphanomyces astaci TaxID=112090 RepID=W4FZT8_APHAT|nr:CAMK/CAMKL protein kinase [Aphanomyces astaci]ETV72980.1 CAMK/CAMKL protein kinase [Aphanomyces astaci]RQM20732.1 hypothetical protein B5M09_004724 [Aphanomyces astaci]|eukprot:XP_009837766.1 CAMK/CAMKL protein kinase [Aphanomyces astaci]